MNKLNLTEISTDAEIALSVCFHHRLAQLSGMSPDYIRDRVKELSELSRLTSWLEQAFEDSYLNWLYGLNS